MLVLVTSDGSYSPLVILEVMLAVLYECLPTLRGHELGRAHRGQQLGRRIAPTSAANTKYVPMMVRKIGKQVPVPKLAKNKLLFTIKK